MHEGEEPPSQRKAAPLCRSEVPVLSFPPEACVSSAYVSGIPVGAAPLGGPLSNGLSDKVAHTRMPPSPVVEWPGSQQVSPRRRRPGKSDAPPPPVFKGRGH